MIEATIKRKFHAGDIVINTRGKIETVRSADMQRVYTLESWERERGWYAPWQLVLLETVEQAQEYMDYTDDMQMYAELSRGM